MFTMTAPLFDRYAWEVATIARTSHGNLLKKLLRNPIAVSRAHLFLANTNLHRNSPCSFTRPALRGSLHSDCPPRFFQQTDNVRADLMYMILNTA